MAVLYWYVPRNSEEMIGDIDSLQLLGIDGSRRVETKDKIKAAMKAKSVDILNITLTSDNRLVKAEKDKEKELLMQFRKKMAEAKNKVAGQQKTEDKEVTPAKTYFTPEIVEELTEKIRRSEGNRDIRELKELLLKIKAETAMKNNIAIEDVGYRSNDISVEKILVYSPDKVKLRVPARDVRMSDGSIKHAEAKDVLNILGYEVKNLSDTPIKAYVTQCAMAEEGNIFKEHEVQIEPKSTIAVTCRDIIKLLLGAEFNRVASNGHVRINGGYKTAEELYKGAKFTFNEGIDENSRVASIDNDGIVYPQYEHIFGYIEQEFAKKQAKKQAKIELKAMLDAEHSDKYFESSLMHYKYKASLLGEDFKDYICNNLSRSDKSKLFSRSKDLVVVDKLRFSDRGDFVELTPSTGTPGTADFVHGERKALGIQVGVIVKNVSNTPIEYKETRLTFNRSSTSREETFKKSVVDTVIAPGQTVKMRMADFAAMMFREEFCLTFANGNLTFKNMLGLEFMMARRLENNKTSEYELASFRVKLSDGGTLDGIRIDTDGIVNDEYNDLFSFLNGDGATLYTKLRKSSVSDASDLHETELRKIKYEIEREQAYKDKIDEQKKILHNIVSAITAEEPTEAEFERLGIKVTEETLSIISDVLTNVDPNSDESIHDMLHIASRYEEERKTQFEPQSAGKTLGDLFRTIVSSNNSSSGRTEYSDEWHNRAAIMKFEDNGDRACMVFCRTDIKNGSDYWTGVYALEITDEVVKKFGSNNKDRWFDGGTTMLNLIDKYSDKAEKLMFFENGYSAILKPVFPMWLTGKIFEQLAEKF